MARLLWWPPQLHVGAFNASTQFVTVHQKHGLNDVPFEAVTPNFVVAVTVITNVMTPSMLLKLLKGTVTFEAFRTTIQSPTNRPRLRTDKAASSAFCGASAPVLDASHEVTRSAHTFEQFNSVFHDSSGYVLNR